MKDDRFFGRGRRLRPLRKPLNRSSRSSLEGVYVWVSHVEEEAARDGLDRDRVRDEVEWRLATAGIPVCYQQEGFGTPATPCLGVLLHLRKADVIPSFYTFSVEVFFIQGISSQDHSSTPTMQMIWCKEAIGDARKSSQGSDWSCLYNHIGSLVDAFIQNYRMSNPQATPAQLIN